LLGAVKPLPLDEKGNPTTTGSELIMREFYKNHTRDPETNGQIVLDPFMGGGTTVVEALRLGCSVIGIDLNPVAWFIVKTEVEPVDLQALNEAFERLANRRVEWSGKSVRETLLEQYKTDCPCCGNEDADIIYTFWVKSGICHNKLCPGRSGDRGAEVPLFSDYIITHKKPSIRYWRDVRCPKCAKVFDWETEPAALVANPELMVNDPRTSAGEGRGNTRWAFSAESSIRCPWCEEEVKPLPTSATGKRSLRRERKKVPLTVLLCPHCQSVWQLRGSALPTETKCPKCKNTYDPNKSNVVGGGKFVCPSCGTEQTIIESIRRLPQNQLLPTNPYGIEGHCMICAKDDAQRTEKSRFFERHSEDTEGTKNASNSAHSCRLTKNNGKFFKSISPADLNRYQSASRTWEYHNKTLLYPKQEIPDGQETRRLLEHHYRCWHQMFNSRQLLCLATLLAGISEENDSILREQLLMCFSSALDTNNMFTRYMPTRTSQGGQTAQGVFARHDFQLKATIAEQNVWGLESGGIGTFARKFALILEGKPYMTDGWDVQYKQDGDKRLRTVIPSGGVVPKTVESVDDVLRRDSSSYLLAQDTRTMSEIPTGALVFVITDPPYAGNVNYAELADFWYVWLRLLLKERYSMFAPETTPKAEEIIENRVRGKTAKDFEVGLSQVFRECHRIIDESGVLVFTFHHAEGSAWEALLHAVCEAGFTIESVYPIQGESESSMHLMEKESAISYDLIHVCKKRDTHAPTNQRSWAGIRPEIRQRAREEIRAIENGRYGDEPLPAADINIVLIGKCLEFYSVYYGRIVDHEGNLMPLHSALEEIRMLVDQLTNEEQELPSALEDIDPPSYIYLTSLCGRNEVKSDEVHKATRGILEPDELLDAGLIIKGRAKRGRTYEVKSAIDRLAVLRRKFGAGNAKPQAELFEQDLSASVRPGVLFIDYVHFLLGLAETGESVIDWLETFRGRRSEIRAALEYIARKNKIFAEPTQRIIGLMDERTLFTRKD
jgi:adenine-specific DNA methylase